ncbi:hypothetical protein OROHE_009966 [Orobanche hederae]
MEEDPENHTTIATASAASAQEYSDDIHSCFSTPYVSAPSSPDRATPLAGFYYSAPASPTHFVISTTNLNSYSSASIAASDANYSFEFDFSATFPSTGASSLEAMIFADELFCNGQIRPMKLSTHLQRPVSRTFDRIGRHRRRRELSNIFSWEGNEVSGRIPTQEDQIHVSFRNDGDEVGPEAKCRVIRTYEYHQSQIRGRRPGIQRNDAVRLQISVGGQEFTAGKKKVENNTRNKNGLCRRLVAPPSVHELHYTANRAQAEEMRKITFLPYRLGLLACLGFSSNNYGPMPSMALLEL